MPIWRINTLSPQELARYRQRSQRAINGLNRCKQDIQLILQQRKVSDKYKLLADYIGLQQEGGNSYYNFFVPLNKNMVFLLRNANLDNRNPNLYDQHEQLGRPNKRFIIFFKKGNMFSDTPIVFQDSEHHVIPYGRNALDNETSVVAYIDALIELFTDGKTTFPTLPIIPQPTIVDNNKELNCNRNMNNKLIRLTESDLHKVVKESVKTVLNEGSDTVSELQQAYEILKKITESDYIPFASPSPSGTELEIKMTILEAKMLISKACYLHKKCYGHKPISNVV